MSRAACGSCPTSGSVKIKNQDVTPKRRAIWRRAKRRSTRCASTRSGPWRWTWSRRPSPGTRAPPWGWRPRATCSSRACCGTIPATPTGPTATASCSRTGTPRRCSTACCTCAGTTCRWTSSSASGSGAAGPRGTRNTGTRPGWRPRPARWGRASATPSAWRSPSGTWRRASTAGRRGSWTTTPMSSAATATSWRGCLRRRPRWPATSAWGG